MRLKNRILDTILTGCQNHFKARPNSKSFITRMPNSANFTTKQKVANNEYFLSVDFRWATYGYTASKKIFN